MSSSILKTLLYVTFLFIPRSWKCPKMRDITLFQTPESSMETQTLCTLLRACLLTARKIASVAQSQHSLLRFFLLWFTLQRVKYVVVQEILISSVSSRKAGLLSHRRKQNSSCSALHEALVQLFLFQPAPQTARKMKFKSCCILLQCYAAGAISLPCFQDCNLTE